MSWLLVFLGFCLLIMLHEAGHYVAAKATGMRVERFFLFFGPTIWSFKRGETEYGIKSIPLGGYVKINGMNPEEEMPPGEEHRAYYRQKVWKRIVVIAAGPAVNIVLAFVILFAVYRVGGVPVAETRPVVAATQPGSSAAAVLQKGDKLVAIGDQSLVGLNGDQAYNRFKHIVSSDRCPGVQADGCKGTTPVEITVKRDGLHKTFQIIPTYSAAEKRMLVGLSFEADGHWVPTSTSEAATESLDKMGEVVTRTASVFAHIFESKQRGEISGIVGTSDIGHEAVEAGWQQALLLLGLVSLSLGVINLLPILPLDGGHILWAIVEKLRGVPVSLRVMERASIIGFALVAMLIVLGLSNDIGHITGEGFAPR
jgi:regulator of sigma E protease